MHDTIQPSPCRPRAVDDELSERGGVSDPSTASAAAITGANERLSDGREESRARGGSLLSPSLVGCCSRCGRAVVVRASVVNDATAYSVRQSCACTHVHVNLWEGTQQ